MSKSIIIIGGGVAGLSVGCYGRMNGYTTTIYELHSLPGGLCTSWKRNGYTFDGCIDWLVGTRPGSSMNSIWRELGALEGRKIYNRDVFMRIEGADRKVFNVYTDIDQLEKEMLRLSPSDEVLIKEFCIALHRFARFAEALPAAGAKQTLFTLLKMIFIMIPVMSDLKKYGKLTNEEFGKKIKDPFLRQCFSQLFGLPGFPMAAMMISLGWQHVKDAGYPLGGSLVFAQAIENRYLSLGGEIHYKARVQKILVEDGRAVGVRLEDGTEARADFVISAADGHATLFEMLEGKFLTDEFRSRYEKAEIFSPIIQVSLGVNQNLSDQPHHIDLFLEKPLIIAGEQRTSLSVRSFSYDPSLAPAGKTSVISIIPSNYEYWKNMAEDSERYESEKKQVAIQVIETLNRRFPGLESHVEVIDVATPLTYERYTGNWKGSMEGWLINTDEFSKNPGGGLAKTLPGLENFYMVGQWVQPGGGLPPAATSAREVIQMICKKDKQNFQTQMV